jgi:hypothetical protein
MFVPLNIQLIFFLEPLFPNAPSYHLAPHEDEEVEHHLQQLPNTIHIQPISSPCASPSFIIPKKEYEE